MTKKGVTIQDIANALGMSRNTVSKALNGQHVPQKTRNAVINAAIEMGYKGYKLASSSDGSSLQQRFLLVSSRLLMNIHYHIYVLRGIEEVLVDKDIELNQYYVNNDKSFAGLTRYIASNKVDGIICIEFFEKKYVQELVNLGIPIVFLDFPVCIEPLSGRYDIILPDGRECVRQLCIRLIREKGCPSFGFVGDYRHCLSFYERFMGMQEALFLEDVPYDPSLSIVHADADTYSPDKLYGSLQAMPALPSCFLAANDTLAINLMAALKKLKIRVPEDVRVIGFDNVPDAKTSSPPLTTFHVNKSGMGQQIVRTLQTQISHPTKANNTIHVASKVILRTSTEA